VSRNERPARGNGEGPAPESPLQEGRRYHIRTFSPLEGTVLSPYSAKMAPISCAPRN